MQSSFHCDLHTEKLKLVEKRVALNAKDTTYNRIEENILTNFQINMVLKLGQKFGSIIIEIIYLYFSRFNLSLRLMFNAINIPVIQPGDFHSKFQ